MAVFTSRTSSGSTLLAGGFLLAGLVSACGGSSSSNGVSTETGDSGSEKLSACEVAASDPDLPSVAASEPVISEAPAAPLARKVQVSADAAARLAIEMDDGQGHHFCVDYPDVASSFDVPLLGLRPDRSYTATVSLDFGGGFQRFTSESQIVTAPLPGNFATISILESDPERMEPGFILMEVLIRGEGNRYVTIVDAEGEVVWYRAYAEGALEADRLPNGNILVLNTGENSIKELDMFGEAVVAYHFDDSTDVEAGSIPVAGAEPHHEALKLPNGNYVTSLRDSSRQVENFPVDEGDGSVRETVFVRDEPVVEFAPDGSIQGRWDFLDFLKTTRIAYSGTRGLPDEGADWVHLNAIWYDDRDDSFIASLRHQDAVVKFSRATGELKWILGPPANWEGFEAYLLTPLGSDFRWQYHQHAPMVTSSGNLLLHDNANEQASPFTGEPRLPAADSWSRAVEYDIDEEAMTVTQVWEYGLNQSGEAIFAPFIGDADELPTTGNIQVNFGGICKQDGVPSAFVRACRVNGRIIEVTHEPEPEKVFDMLVEDDDPTKQGFSVYRADRIATIYPDPDVAVTPLP